MYNVYKRVQLLTTCIVILYNLFELRCLLFDMSVACCSRYLSRREQRLLKRRKAAEKVLKQQQELLKKEQILDHEEEQVNKLVNEALTCYQQRTKIKKERTKERSRHSSSEEAAIVNKPESPKSREMSAGSPPLIAKEAGVIDRSKKKEEIQTRSSISEDIRPSNTITEEISEVLLSKASTSQPLSVPSVHTTSPKVPSNYAMDTFESFQSTTLSHQDHPPHPTTSTPSHESFKKQPQASEDLSISITGEPFCVYSEVIDVLLQTVPLAFKNWIQCTVYIVYIQLMYL